MKDSLPKCTHTLRIYVEHSGTQCVQKGHNAQDGQLLEPHDMNVMLLFAAIILSHPYNLTAMHKMETFRDCMICVCWPSLILCEASVW